MSRTIAREAAVLALFLLLSVAMTWPLAAHLDRAVAHPGDPFWSTWVIDWGWHATLTDATLFDANMFHPAKKSLAFSEASYGIGILLLPLFLAGLAPLTVHNVGILLGFVFCGYTAYLLARWVTRSTGAAIAGGIAFAFIGFRFHHLAHLTYVWSAWLPLMLLGALAYAEKPTWKRALLLGGATLMNGLTSLTFFAFAMPALGLVLLVEAIRTKHLAEWRWWLPLAISMLLVAIVMVPFVLPYGEVAKEYGMVRSADDLLPNSAEWRDWLTPNLQNRNYGHLSPERSYSHERTLFPGFAILVLSVIGIVFFARRGTPRMKAALIASGIWLMIGALGARGMKGWFYSILFELSSAYRGMRMPVRWVFISYVSLALLAAIGTFALMQMRSRVARAAIATVVCGVLLFELRAAPIRYFLVPLDPRPVYEWVRDTPIGGAVVELPLSQDLAYEYLWRSSVHHKPLINGVSSYLPPWYAALSASYEQEPVPDELLDRLEKLGTSIVIVHAGGLRHHEPAVRDWLTRGIASGRLSFVRHFDAGARGDWVFALTRNAPDASAWRAPEVPDRAGRTPSQNLDRFLGGDPWIATSASFVFMDKLPSETLRGPQEFSGWVHAEAGVREVIAHFGNDSYRQRAETFDRPDVQQLMPWAGRDAVRAFAVKARRPRSIEGETDLQLEVIDVRGRSTFMPPLFFEWR